MRRLIGIVLLSLIILACLPTSISVEQAQTTAMAVARTLAAQTLAALPTPTSFPIQPSVLASPTLLPLAAPTDAPHVLTPTSSPTPSGSAVTSTFTPTTSTSTATPTPTQTIVVTASRTPTATPGPLIYGTVPPAVPYGFVTLRNLSARPAYISFQCILENDLITIIEYPVYGRIKIKLPTGLCLYVAYVRGKAYSGEIRIKRFEEYTFTFKRNNVLITQP